MPLHSSDLFHLDGFCTRNLNSTFYGDHYQWTQDWCWRSMVSAKAVRNQMVPPWVDEMRWTTKQPRLSAIVQARHFSLCGHAARIPHMPKSLNSFPLENRTALILRGWRLSSRTWNPTTSKKQSTWLRIVHSGDWYVHLCYAFLVLHARYE